MDYVAIALVYFLFPQVVERQKRRKLGVAHLTGHPGGTPQTMGGAFGVFPILMAIRDLMLSSVQGGFLRSPCLILIKTATIMISQTNLAPMAEEIDGSLVSTLLETKPSLVAIQIVFWLKSQG
jgi:hypothetical protein